MPVNPNMIAIQTVTVGSGGAATIDFTNIPQTYTDLLMKISTRSTVGGTGQDDINVTFNGSTSSYSWRNVLGSGSSAISQNGGSSNIRMSAVSPNAGTASSTFSNAELYIPNYAGSNNKSVSIDMVSEANQTATYMGLVAGLWSNSSAITQVTLTGASGNFAQYSTATLYGVTSAAYGAKATGGIITSDADYYYHTFLASGTFTPTANISANYLVVAGGGATYYDGLTDRAWVGGGGAGGYRTNVGGTLISLTNGTAYTVTVGAGGTRGTTPTKGGNSSIAGTGLTTISATGGGPCKNGNGSGNLNGGSSSGGVGGPGGPVDFTGNEGGYSPVEGYSGGAGGSTYGGGGGGSAGNGTSGATGNNAAGGAGTSNSISGTAVTYAAGGNGGNANGGAFVSGAANTGNGAGYGGNGGSGIVIVRYAK